MEERIGELREGFRVGKAFEVTHHIFYGIASCSLAKQSPNNVETLIRSKFSAERGRLAASSLTPFAPRNDMDITHSA
jgi:hypothetical protein